MIDLYSIYACKFLCKYRFMLLHVYDILIINNNMFNNILYSSLEKDKRNHDYSTFPIQF